MTIIVRNDQLAELCQKIDACGRLGLDLEFIPERTYNPELCLVQVSTDDDAFIVDPVYVKELTPLWQRIADPNILVVLHAAEQDLDLVMRASGLLPQNIMDTQIAAGFAGFGYPVGYSKLLSVLLGVNIAKSESYSDWLNRPLTAAQIDYALDDVRHLLPMYDKLTEKLNRAKRFTWAQEECERYCTAEYYEKDRSRQYLRIKGANALSRRPLAVLKALVEWRDQVASRHNKPIRSILSDSILLELARRSPKQAEDIVRIRSVRQDQLRMYGEQIVEVVQKGLSTPLESCPTSPSQTAPSKAELIRGDVLFLVLKILAYNHGLAPELVATRDDLQYLLRMDREGKTDEADLPLLKGWRRILAGEQVLKVLGGADLGLRLPQDREMVDIKIEDGES